MTAFKQLEIDYFFPLREQLALDLDFTESNKPKMWTLNNDSSSSYLKAVGTGTTSWVTAPCLTINIDQMPITVVSKKKPSFIKQFLYNYLGVKWRAE